MINAVIIDDEKDARYLLKKVITEQFPETISVIAEAGDIDEGVEIIRRFEPQLVFLDIKMHEGTGFDLLQKVPDKNFEVIFITAYDQHAVKAFQFSAFGYLLKPIKISELQAVIENLKTYLSRISTTDQRLKVLIENYGDERKSKKLVLGNMEGFKVIDLESIIRLEGARNYTNFIIEGEKDITVSRSLGEYEELLSEFGFFRVHQSTIVNLRFIKGYLKGDGGEIEMSDGKFVKLSRHRKTDFMKKFL